MLFFQKQPNTGVKHFVWLLWRPTRNFWGLHAQPSCSHHIPAFLLLWNTNVGCSCCGDWAPVWSWGEMVTADTHTGNMTAGLLFCQEIRQNEGSLPVGNFCFDFHLSLFSGPLSPHQDPLPSSLLFFLFPFYILASISASWCDVYCSNECGESRGWWQVLTLLSSLCCCPPAWQTQLFCWHSVSLTLMVCLRLAL